MRRTLVAIMIAILLTLSIASMCSISPISTVKASEDYNLSYTYFNNATFDPVDLETNYTRGFVVLYDYQLVYNATSDNANATNTLYPHDKDDTYIRTGYIHNTTGWFDYGEVVIDGVEKASYENSVSGLENATEDRVRLNGLTLTIHSSNASVLNYTMPTHANFTCGRVQSSGLVDSWTGGYCWTTIYTPVSYVLEGAIATLIVVVVITVVVGMMKKLF